MTTPRGIRLTRTAVVAYTAVFTAGSLLSIKRGYPAKPLGMDAGVDAKRGVFNGLHGAGLAAPWTMIAQMWVAAALAARSDRSGRWARAWLAFLSAMFIVGAVGEPVSHKVVTRELPPLDTAVASANIVVPFVMLAGALRSLIETEK